MTILRKTISPVANGYCVVELREKHPDGTIGKVTGYVVQGPGGDSPIFGSSGEAADEMQRLIDSLELRPSEDEPPSEDDETSGPKP